MIVSRGTLKKNAILVAGNTWARVRTMQNDLNKVIQKASPSTPVQIAGWFLLF